MAGNKKQGFSLTASPNFITQLIFGAFLTLILLMIGYEPPVSIFIGILAGFTIGWINEANKTGPQPETIASSDGVDAGLKYWLFFLVGFILLRYSPPMSILLGALAGLGGGLIVAWWGSKESTQTDLPPELIEEEYEQPATVGQKRFRRTVRRSRRPKGEGFRLRFWD